MNLASALIKQIITQRDITTWSALRENYLPGEFKKLFRVIDKHIDQFKELPSFDDLKLEIRDKRLQERIFAIESVEVDADADAILEYLKNEYAQVIILDELDKYIEESIAMSSAEENVEALQSIILKVEENIDLEDPSENMQTIELFDSEEELANFMPLGLNQDFDIEMKFSPEDFILIGGRRGSGKSVTCTNIANNIIDCGKSSIYFTIEMNTRSILQRACSNATGVPLSRLRLKELTSQEWMIVAKWWANRFEEGELILRDYSKFSNFEDFHHKLTKNPLKEDKRLDIVYDPSLTVSKIKAELDIKLAKSDYGVIVIDYLNQVKRAAGPMRKGSQYDWIEQIEIAKELKSIAQEYKCMVFSAYQTDATGEARFSKGILDSCDAAFALESYEEADACMSFTNQKMRNGPMLSFTSEMDWASIKIGPKSTISPLEKKAMKKDMEDPDDI